MQNSHNHIFNGNLVPMQYIQGAVLSSLILNVPFIIHLTPICTQVYFWVLFYSSDLFVYSTQTTNYCCFIFLVYLVYVRCSLLFFFNNFLVIITFFPFRSKIDPPQMLYWDFVWNHIQFTCYSEKY